MLPSLTTFRTIPHHNKNRENGKGNDEEDCSITIKASRLGDNCAKIHVVK